MLKSFPMHCRISSLSSHTLCKRFNSSTTRVGFIGASCVNFGALDGPWNHALRLEQHATSGKFGDIQVMAIADINTSRAQNVINSKQTEQPSIYSQCQAYSSWQDMINDPSLNLNTIIIGTPPSTRGSVLRHHDMELQCIQKGLDILVEKPLSNENPGDFLRYAIEVNDAQTDTKSVRDPMRNPIISVGYMFRYHPAIRKMKELLRDRPILHLNMRYQCAYPYINKPFWWDQNQSGGPIVEQGTHFIDLARFLCGECVMETLGTNALFYGDRGLKCMPHEVDIKKIENGMVNQIVTGCTWKSDQGVLVNFAHGVHLRGNRYESYIDLWADGVSMNLSNPYDAMCLLRVRDNESDDGLGECGEKIYTFDVREKMEFDPYWEQMRCFLENVTCTNGNVDGGKIESDYNDAAYTYILTKDIQKDVMSKDVNKRFGRMNKK